nr:(+)-neomenthol dehydrogenase [Quercus suber]
MAEAPKSYAVVTGGNRNRRIGFETCRQSALSGVTVVLTSRDEKRGLEAVDKLKESGLTDHVVFHQLDITDPASIARAGPRPRQIRPRPKVDNAGVRGSVVDGDTLRNSDFKLAPSVDNEREHRLLRLVSHIIASRTKELHGPYSLNGKHQQRSKRRTTPNCTREIGRGTQEQDQEGTSADRREREGLEGSNTPSRAKQQNLSMPSLTDATQPHIATKIQAIKEQMEVMINALRGRVFSDLDDLVNRTDSPFTATVNSFPLPRKFRMPHIDSYDGVKDPLDHLETFKTLMHLQGVADEIMCKAFPTTLKGPARVWFSRLMPNSISTFKELGA